YNRTKKKADPLLSQGAQLADSPAEAAQKSDVVLTMLADDAIVKDAVFGENGVLATLPEGGVHISSSTISVDFSEELEKAHTDAGQYFIAAPIMGRPDAVAKGDIRVMIAGQKAGRNKAWSLFESLSDELFVVGDQSLLANVCKLSNNFLLVSMLESVSEAITLAEEYGVDK